MAGRALWVTVGGNRQHNHKHTKNTMDIEYKIEMPEAAKLAGKKLQERVHDIVHGLDELNEEARRLPIGEHRVYGSYTRRVVLARDHRGWWVGLGQVEQYPMPAEGNESIRIDVVRVTMGDLPLVVSPHGSSAPGAVAREHRDATPLSDSREVMWSTVTEAWAKAVWHDIVALGQLADGYVGLRRFARYVKDSGGRPTECVLKHAEDRAELSFGDHLEALTDAITCPHDVERVLDMRHYTASVARPNYKIVSYDETTRQFRTDGYATIQLDIETARDCARERRDFQTRFGTFRWGLDGVSVCGCHRFDTAQVFEFLGVAYDGPKWGEGDGLSEVDRVIKQCLELKQSSDDENRAARIALRKQATKAGLDYSAQQRLVREFEPDLRQRTLDTFVACAEVMRPHWDAIEPGLTDRIITSPDDWGVIKREVIDKARRKEQVTRKREARQPGSVTRQGWERLVAGAAEELRKLRERAAGASAYEGLARALELIDVRDRDGNLILSREVAK